MQSSRVLEEGDVMEEDEEDEDGKANRLKLVNYKSVMPSM